MITSVALFMGWSCAVIEFDYRRRRIPNWLVASGFAVAVITDACGYPVFRISISESALGLLAGFAVWLPFYGLRVLGAADVKIFAVLGASCGIHGLLPVWIGASLAAGAHALFLNGRNVLMLAHATHAAHATRGRIISIPNSSGSPCAALLALSACASLMFSSSPAVS